MIYLKGFSGHDNRCFNRIPDEVGEQIIILEGSMLTINKALEIEDGKQISGLLMKDVKQSFEKNK